MKDTEAKDLVITWQCLTCESQPKFTGNPAIIEHLQTVHALEGEIRGTKTPISFMDGKGWAAHLSNWTIPSGAGDIKLLQTVEIQR
jgi:hypothetical protein